MIASAGIAMLRPAKPLAPEVVTGSDLAQEGGLYQGGITMETPATARVTPRSGLNVRVRGRSTRDPAAGELGSSLSAASGAGSTRVTVNDRRRPLRREDLRRWRT